MAAIKTASKPQIDPVWPVEILTKVMSANLRESALGYHIEVKKAKLNALHKIHFLRGKKQLN